jgi:hypothetical protein
MWCVYICPSLHRYTPWIWLEFAIDAFFLVDMYLHAKIFALYHKSDGYV